MEEDLIHEMVGFHRGGLTSGVTIVYHSTKGGKCPYLKWFNGLDSTVRHRINN